MGSGGSTQKRSEVDGDAHTAAPKATAKPKAKKVFHSVVTEEDMRPSSAARANNRSPAPSSEDREILYKSNAAAVERTDSLLRKVSLSNINQVESATCSELGTPSIRFMDDAPSGSTSPSISPVNVENGSTNTSNSPAGYFELATPIAPPGNSAATAKPTSESQRSSTSVPPTQARSFSLDGLMPVHTRTQSSDSNMRSLTRDRGRKSPCCVTFVDNDDSHNNSTNNNPEQPNLNAEDIFGASDGGKPPAMLARRTSLDGSHRGQMALPKRLSTSSDSGFASFATEPSVSA